jgi:RNA polymerase sigma-70 factor, ECF subfamily
LESTDARQAAPPARATTDATAGSTPDRGDLGRWLAATAAGDRRAFQSLYLATHEHLLGVAFQLLGHRGRAEEALQDAFVRVWQHAGSYQPQVARPMTWMINIVRNRAIDLLRAQRLERQQTVEADAEAIDNVADFQPLPEQLLDRALADARLAGALRDLPRNQRQALALVLYRGLSYPEVAAALNVPLPTVKSWVRRALPRLRERATGEASAGRERDGNDDKPASNWAAAA